MRRKHAVQQKRNVSCYHPPSALCSASLLALWEPPVRSGGNKGATHANKVPYARPKTVVWKLTPAARMGDCPVVKYATKKIHQHSNHEDESKDAPGTNATRLVRFRMRAGV